MAAVMGVPAVEANTSTVGLLRHVQLCTGDALHSQVQYQGVPAVGRSAGASHFIDIDNTHARQKFSPIPFSSYRLTGYIHRASDGHPEEEISCQLMPRTLRMVV